MNKLFRPFIDLLGYVKLFQNYLGAKMYFIFLFSAIASLLEGFGILMLLPLLESIGSIEKSNEASGAFSEVLYNTIGFFGLPSSAVSVLFLITVIFIFKGILSFIAYTINAYLIGFLLKKIKVDLFELYTNMSYSYYASKNTGDFINLIAEQPNRAIESFKQLILFGSHLINTVVLITLAFGISFSFGSLALVAGLLLLVLFLRMNAFVQELSRINAKENSTLNKWLVQVLHGFKYLVTTNQIKILKRNIFSSINILTSNQVKSGIAGGFTQAIREPLAVVLIIVIIYFQLIVFEQRLEPILVSIALFYRALNSTLAVQSAFQGTFQLIGSMELINEEYQNQNQNHVDKGETKISDFKNTIILKNVFFRYPKSKKDCLKDLNLKIPANSSIGVVGESGSGKTTLVDLIVLLHPLKKGSITIDGISSNKIEKESWRNQVGYISQDTVIFDDTIANNITMWASTGEVDQEQIKAVAMQANILDFIESLPNGFQTRVGDRGIQLSGGQKQRIFIARELFRKPSILILDEATSSLDSKAEKFIQKSIENIQGTLTLIIIAHRISTLKNVDTIIVIEKGQIAQTGTYNELKEKSNAFQELISHQNI